MENVSSTATTTTTPTTTTTQRQHNLQQCQQEQQQQQIEQQQQQQFCLRWHNHQTSLLSTLPVLLDQSHLTDVTISAEGRNLRAHRIVLSACSSFFLELFRTLDAANHPVIIIPGASFAAIVALLTFMYSGEVNVYEEQIPNLLSLAETLGIKGLADVQHNLQKSSKQQYQKADYVQNLSKMEQQDSPNPINAVLSTPPPAAAPSTPTSATSQSSLLSNDCGLPFPELPLSSPQLAQKLTPSLESFFLKSLQLYPNLLPQPLNFSQSALHKTNEILAKYQQQCGNLYSNAYGGVGGLAKELLMPTLSPAITAAAAAAVATVNTCNDANNKQIINEDNNEFSSKRYCSGERKLPILTQQQQQQQKDIKRIDKIVESLRTGNKTQIKDNNNVQQHQHRSQQQQQQLQQLGIKSTHCNYTPISAQSSPTHTQSGLSQLTTRAGYYGNSSLSGNVTEQHHQQHHQQQRHAAAVAAAAAAFMASEQQHQQQQLTEQLSRQTPTSMDSVQSPMDTLPSLLLSSVAASGNSVASTSMTMTSTSTGATNKSYASNSKLYATCFICHKQLSNQYNLRVHLETHQNVRYACNVCSHVSRSKDALRKHVSYRHPGAPSPCETEARRKRASKVACLSAVSTSGSSATATTGFNLQYAITTPANVFSTTSPNTIPTTSTTTAAATTTASSPLTLSAALAAAAAAVGTAISSETVEEMSNSSNNNINNNNNNNVLDHETGLSMAAAAQLSSAYMFLPNQLHFAAAVAATQQQQQQQVQYADANMPSRTAAATPTSTATTADMSGTLTRAKTTYDSSKIERTITASNSFGNQNNDDVQHQSPPSHSSPTTVP